METKEREIYKEIKEILQKNKDAEKGFAKAAENAKGIALQEYFKKKSNDRRNFNERLLTEIRASYPEMKLDGSFTGTIHRAWMDIKALFSADDDESMLEEAIRGDKAAIEEYDDVIGYSVLPTNLSKLLIEQREKIQTDIRNNSTLEDLK